MRRKSRLSWASQHSFMNLCLLLSAPTILADIFLSLPSSPPHAALLLHAECPGPENSHSRDPYHQEALEVGQRNQSLAITPSLSWLGRATLGVITPVTPADFCYGNRKDFQPSSSWESVLQIQIQVLYSYMGSL